MKKKEKLAYNVFDDIYALSKMLESSEEKILNLFGTNILPKKFDSGPRYRRFEESTENNNLTAEEIEKVQGLVGQLSQYLQCSNLEAILFVVIFSDGYTRRRGHTDMADICQFLYISNFDVLRLKPSVEHLVELELVTETERGGSDTELFVPDTVKKAVFANEHIQKKKPKPIDEYDFCKQVSDWIEMRSNEKMTTQELFNKVRNYEKANSSLPMVADLKRQKLSAEARTLFYEICDDCAQGSNSGLNCTLKDIYDSNRDRILMAGAFQNESHVLQTKKLVELLPASFFTQSSLALTDQGEKIFFQKEYEQCKTQRKRTSKLLEAAEIKEKPLFYEPKFQAQVDFLRQNLDDDKFKALQKRLADNSLPKGVAAIFYGSPGTGKTETAMQIAKATGRSVYHVDIAASKSCWFGESEKLIKKIFTDYEEMCKTEEKKPILLFNEADALFSKRKDGSSSSVAQTENAIQNILLEEMEKLDGILIATTNLSGNLDSAFERRFLFKIKFEQPTTEAKQMIWRSKLAWLSEEDCRMLAGRFNFSGGEIDNVVRKVIMEEVISGSHPDIAFVEDLCNHEKLSNNSTSNIGFCK